MPSPEPDPDQQTMFGDDASSSSSDVSSSDALLPNSSSSTDDDHPLPPPPPSSHQKQPQPQPLSFAAPDPKPDPIPDDSRRLFQRLWTDDDEIVILQGFYEFTSQRGTTHHAHQHDTGPFYDQIRTKLQLDFNKNQLVEKLRRLKKKYRNVVSRMATRKDFHFKTPHDQATYEIARKIWGNTVVKPANSNFDHDDDDGASVAFPDGQKTVVGRKRGRKQSATNAVIGLEAVVDHSEAVAVEVKAVPSLMSNPVPATNSPSITPNVVEDTVKSCISPLLKEIMQSSVGGGFGSALGMGLMPLSLVGDLGSVREGLVGEKWRKQQILELEVFSKRLELVQEQIKATLEELQSSPGSS